MRKVIRSVYEYPSEIHPSGNELGRR